MLVHKKLAAAAIVASTAAVAVLGGAAAATAVGGETETALTVFETVADGRSAIDVTVTSGADGVPSSRSVTLDDLPSAGW